MSSLAGDRFRLPHTDVGPIIARSCGPTTVAPAERKGTRGGFREGVNLPTAELPTRCQILPTGLVGAGHGNRHLEGFVE